MHDLILESYPHFIQGSKTKGYDVIGANVFLFTLMDFTLKKQNQCAIYYFRYSLYIIKFVLNPSGMRVGGHLIKECA